MNNRSEIKEEIQHLRNKIFKYNDAYYNEDRNIISDEEYDRELRKLIELEEKYPEFKEENSPTNRIGHKVSKGRSKVKLSHKMMSLSNVFSIEELEKYIEGVKEVLGEDVEFIVELKIDGLAIELTYNYGFMVCGATRGDGLVGENVTDNIETIKDLPKYIGEIKDKEEVIVHGEVYILEDDFKRINKNQGELGEKKYANKRNLASGTVRQSDTKVAEERNLQVTAYRVIGLDNISTQEDSLRELEKLGIPVCKKRIVTKDIDEIVKYIEEAKELREDLNYGIDGVVIKVNNLEKYNILGETSKTPRWATAYKLPSVEKETRIIDVEFNVGRTGVITPVAILEGIEIDGSVVRRATLENQEYIDKKDIRINDIVKIRKSGDIIPEVLEVVKEKRTGNEVKVEIPKECPSCGSLTGKVGDEVAVRCFNKECGAKVIEGIIHFASKEAMDISGLGDKTIEELYRKGKIKNISDIYKLTEEDLNYLDNIGEKKISNILNAIEESKSKGLERVILGLGIPLVGKKVADSLAREFKLIESLVYVKELELFKVKEIGLKTSQNIVKYFNNDENVDMLVELSKSGLVMEYTQEEEVIEGSTVEGKTVVVTGKFTVGSRSFIEEELKKRGAKVVGSVSKNTDYVFAGEKAGSKLTKAEEIGIKVLGEADIEDILR